MPSERTAHWSDIVRSTDFYRDIVVTILGVLIALGIGEIAQAFDWKQKSEDATHAINVELSNNAGTFQERVFLQPCLDRRIGELEKIYLQARSSGRLPEVGAFGATPYRGLETAAWDDAVSSGALSHMSQQQKSRLASVYPTVANFNDYVMDEQMMWYRLQLMQHAAGPVSDSMLAEIGSTLKQLTYRVRMNGILARQLLTFTDDRGLEPNLGVFGPGTTPAALGVAVAQRSICKPLEVG